MGNDTPISALSDKPKLAVHLLQAELRAGHEPADRPDPRRTGDEPGLDHRAAAEPVRPRRPRSTPSGSRCASRSSPMPTWKRSARSRRSATATSSRVTLDITLPAEHGADGLEDALDALCARAEAAVRDGINIIILSDRARWRRPHPDPGAARLRGRASSPDPPGPAHLGRPRRRIGRAARGASLRLPGRLRRRSDQSVSRLRDADRHEGRAAGQSSTRRKSSSATSSRSTRACSR